MEVKRINISNVTAGMVVAENVYNSINQLIVPRDAALTDKAIARMRFHSIMSVKIYTGEDIPAPAADTKPAADRSYFDKLRETEEFVSYSRSFDNSMGVFENKLSKMIADDSEPDTNALVESVHSLHDSCRTGIQVFDLLHCMRSYDDQTFAHSLNVSLICAVLGTWLGYGSDDIDILMQCGIFHDIGKLKIPKEILEKPGQLTTSEYNLVQTHTTLGYNALRNKNVDTRVKLSAMMHHERCNGTGYPLTLKSDQIEPFAKIVAIADVYEAMTSPRKYRKPICPFTVIRSFETDGLVLFDPKFIMTFMENITQSYLGNRVRLSNGTEGTIIYINKLSYSRPMIQVDEETYIDLTKDMSLSIEAIL